MAHSAEQLRSNRDIIPWEFLIDASFLLHDLARLIARHVVLPKGGVRPYAPEFE